MKSMPDGTIFHTDDGYQLRWSQEHAVWFTGQTWDDRDMCFPATPDGWPCGLPGNERLEGEFEVTGLDYPVMGPTPIEQEIIDGKMYWDTFGPTHYRLMENSKAMVIGPECKVRGVYTRLEMNCAEVWEAVFHQEFDVHDLPSKKLKRGTATADQARRWVEHMVQAYGGNR